MAILEAPAGTVLRFPDHLIRLPQLARLAVCLYTMEYSAKFDVKAYLEDYYSSLIGNDGDATFELQQYHRFFETYSCKWDETATKILEFGAGPVISHVISAARHANEVVLASYTEQERQELTRWKNGSDDAHDWSVFFKHVVCELESKPEDAAWRERIELLRSRLTITSCDINKEHPIGTSTGEGFTVVCSNLCLEAACKTYDDYKAAVLKLGKLVQVGGYLVLFAVERETFYMVGECKWFCLYLTLAQIKAAMEGAGFDILWAERNPAPVQQIQNPIVSDFTSALFIVGLKVIH